MMRVNINRVLGVFLMALLWSNAFASAVFETLSGDVRVAAAQGPAAAATRGQRIEPGATVTTGGDGQTLLRFDDGQAVLLNPDSEFKITAFQFNRDRPQTDSVIFDLFKGAMRTVSGLIGARNASVYALRVPQATIGIRGTDFMVAVVNPAYMQVLSGAISAANTAGTVVFSAGATAVVETAVTLATAIPASVLPASVASSFNSMSSVAISATGAAGAGSATGAAAGGLTPAAIGAIAAGVAAAAAITSQSTTTTATGATGTTGTTGTR